MMIVVDTKKTPAEILEALPAACAAHKFGVLGSRDLRATLKEKGQEIPRAVTVFDVCNPVHAKNALEADPAVSTMLPCRVAAYEMPGGHVRLATVRPTALVGGMKNPVLDRVAKEVEQTMEAILRDAAK
jgi:uncharacterized protein (DUF302 family)